MTQITKKEPHFLTYKTQPPKLREQDISHEDKDYTKCLKSIGKMHTSFIREMQIKSTQRIWRDGSVGRTQGMCSPALLSNAGMLACTWSPITREAMTAESLTLAGQLAFQVLEREPVSKIKKQANEQNDRG